MKAKKAKSIFSNYIAPILFNIEVAALLNIIGKSLYVRNEQQPITLVYIEYKVEVL